MRLALLALLALPALALAQGSLAPPADAFLGNAPKATMKTLDQLEARTPLTQPAGSTTGLSISVPGSYYLTGNVTVASGDAITISADNVTLDLNGFTISTTASASTGTAIYLLSYRKNITIRNGHISSPITVNANTGAITGTGFLDGISCQYSLTNALVSDLTISGCKASGIFLDFGSTVEHCVVTNCGRYGIAAQVVSDCSAQNCNDTAISGTTIANCQGFSNSNAGISGKSVTNCTGSALADRVAISATTAIGCTAQSGTISANQIDGRAVVGAIGGSSTPVTIYASGSYMLLGNIDLGSTGGTAITIVADNVTLDLNGFTISSAANPAAGSAILINGAYSAIAIRNGHIRGTTTYTSPTFTLGGFSTGISYLFEGGRGHSAEGISVMGVATNGIRLSWAGSTITGCTASICGGQGLTANAVHNSSAVTCGSSAIKALAVSNCSATSVDASGGNPGISAKTATNCYGTGTSGPGIDAVAVTGCSGESVNGCGINATSTAADSFGTSTNSTGLSTATATNCYGYSYSGWGLYAQEATNCHGKSANGTRGLHAANTATGCTGEITTATCPTNAATADYPRGLSAGAAENCTGTITTANGSCYGLFASTATNCTGTITAGGDTSYASAGLCADTATGCRGECSHSSGLTAIVATNSCGNSTNSYGLAAGTATNCYGSSTNYTGLRAKGTASFCRGRTGGTGMVYAIDAAIAVACTADAGSINVTQANGKQLGTP